MKKQYELENLADNVDRRIKKSIQKVTYVFIVLLVSLFCQLAYLQSFGSDFLANHPLNNRAAMLNKETQRGKIIDKNGKVLVHSVADKDGFKRIYLFGRIMSHVTGYCSEQYGKAGIENTFDGYLSGLNSPQRRFGALARLWGNSIGNDVQLTIDLDLQQTAVKELGNRRGAIVVLNPKTGEILAMVSAPTFDPGNIDKDWETILQASGSPLLNRTLLGLYPPGSTIKPITAEIALTEKITDKNRIFPCAGELKIGTDYILHEANHEIHGKVNLTEALAESCNVTFATLAMELGGARLAKSYDRYGFYRTIEELGEKAANLPDFSRLNNGELAQVGIGQGDLLVTPLRMAMIASTFANKGVMMKPYLVSKVLTSDKTVLKDYLPEIWLKPVKPDIAEEIKKMMLAVVDKGTGRSARITGIQVAGKTGTAENSQKADHAWFIGFAPAENPRVAVAVIVENAGWGAEAAAPIARHIIEKALH